MANRRNFYRMLQVQPDAATEVIRASYRTLMQKLRLHPDLGGDAATAALINEAYRVLTDDTLRAAYDAEHGYGLFDRETEPAATHAPAAPASRPDPACGCPFCGARYPGDDATTVRCLTCRAPLYMGVGYDGSNGLDIRRVPRLERRLPLDYLTHWPQRQPHRGEVEDLSIDGMRFRTDQSVERERMLRLDCELLDAVARVIDAQRVDEAEWQVRSAFVSVAFKRRSGGFVAAKA